MKKLLIISLSISLFACNSNSTSTTKTADSTTDKTSAAPTISVGGATKITVQLTGGANAGSYTASSDEPTCSMGLTGPKSFGNQYSVNGKANNEFSSLQLLVDDYDAAKAGTDKFYIKVSFGKVLEGKAYEISGSDNSLSGKKQGSGKLTLVESGNTKTATITGKTADGVTIDATLICNSVVTASGGQ